MYANIEVEAATFGADNDVNVVIEVLSAPNYTSATAFVEPAASGAYTYTRTIYVCNVF